MVVAAVAYYRDCFGFDAPHETGDFAVLVRDDAVPHLSRVPPTTTGAHART
jgi:hypothetical protein